MLLLCTPQRQSLLRMNSDHMVNVTQKAEPKSHVIKSYFEPQIAIK